MENYSVIQERKNKMSGFLAAAALVAGFTAASPVVSAQTDFADRDCRIVLRSARLADCNLNHCTLIAEVDVDKSLGQIPKLLYRTSEEEFFTESGPLREKPGDHGAYIRYTTFAHPLPGIVLSRNPVEFIPFIGAGDERWFDHNVIEDGLGNYQLNEGSQPEIDQYSGVCD